MIKLKKIGAIILAVMMLAVVFAAFADPADVAGDGVVGDFVNDEIETQEKSVKLYKEIKVFNPESSTINAPTISYSYTLTPVAAGKEIYDVKTAHDPNANAHVLTKAGITAGVKINNGSAGTASSATGTVSWTPSDEMTASSDGEKNTKPIEIDFTGVTFTGAGVYRYQITEAATSYTSSGVVEDPDYANHIRYLDVYVKDSATNAGSYDIYGYVCFTNNNDIDARDGATTNTVAAAGKTEGFVDVDSDDDGDYSDAGDVAADRYYTFNVTVTKVLTGDQAMSTHQFPFKVEFANTTVTANVLPVVSGSGTYTAPTLTAGALTSFEVDGTSETQAKQMKIANGGSVTFTGIPAGTTLTIDEYNDVSGTTYITYATGGTTEVAEDDAVNVTWNTWASDVTGWTDITAVEETANSNTEASDNVIITFNNKLLTISPTGLVLRYAPYMLILVGGIALLIIAKKHKKHTEED